MLVKKRYSKPISSRYLIKGESPAAVSTFHEAVKEGNEVNVVQALEIMFGLPSYVHVDSKDIKRNTAVMWAARRGHTPIVELLVKGGSNVNDENDELQTAATLACMEGHLDVVKLLHKSKASFRHRDAKGNNCLLLAAFHDHMPVCEFLLSIGEELLVSNNDNYFVLSYYGMSPFPSKQPGSAKPSSRPPGPRARTLHR